MAIQFKGVQNAEKRDLFEDPLPVEKLTEGKNPAPGEIRRNIVDDLLREIKQREERAQRSGKQFRKINS